MVYVFLAPGFEEVEALCPLDILRRARLDVITVGIGGREVTGAHGITVLADISDSDWMVGGDATSAARMPPSMQATDAVLLPGGMPGTTHLDASPVVDAALKTAVASGAWLCAICAAPLVLGKRGLLSGLHATCYPGFEDQLIGAVHVEEKVVRDGRCITAAGMGVAMEFGLEMVRVLVSPEEADRIHASIQAR